MPRIALGLEYDGSGYQGWQSQPISHSVASLQDILQAALSKISAESIQVVCAGRTDAGVHAKQQIVHFDTQALRPLNAWVRGVNALLPNSMTVIWAQAVPDNFHARFDAKARKYVYWLRQSPQKPALSHGQFGWIHTPLSVDKMRIAAQGLLGVQDFSSFRSSQCQAHSPIRTLHSLEIHQPTADLLGFEFEANAFLHHMIRNIMGALIYVGCGRWTQAEFDAAFAARDRRQSAPTFMPDGLYFLGATYPTNAKNTENTENTKTLEIPDYKSAMSVLYE